MQFIELTPEEFRKYAAKSPYKSFYQTPEIAKLRESNGWVPYYFGIKNGNKLVAASMVVAKPTFLGKSTFYAPGGPLLDYEDASLVNYFLKNLRRYAKTHNGYVLHIEPYYELIERDRYGKPVEGGFNHIKALNNLKNAGFQALPESDEPKYAFVMDIKGHTADNLFKNFKANTRNHIRKAEKKGVKVRELKREELNIFKQITESTSDRRNFQDKPLSYYEQMYDLFTPKGEVKFLLAEADGIPMSAAMFMLYGDEVIYLFSGSDEQYMKEYNAQYLIQWHMIKYAVEHKYKRYNFYGINGLPDESSKDYGIYVFKKGFGGTTGHVTELIGAHEASTNSTFYTLHRLLHQLRHRNS
ncbi:peptidoglycan bridge formation glycyltransferase FemA/FemB family protein [Candidatus Saccharibacteria bacterium]|nr:peptidoglycan bridge formation glycyltransferase FemA/FemB family protein [Candidatus Saccharibacteria bacterium]